MNVESCVGERVHQSLSGDSTLELPFIATYNYSYVLTGMMVHWQTDEHAPPAARQDSNLRLPR